MPPYILFTNFKLQMEPLSVAVHALVNLGKVRANQTVAVFGAGMFIMIKYC